MEICVDFDGTCVPHNYENTGFEIGSIPVLKRLVATGNHLVLFSMRSGRRLDEAVDWFIQNGILLYGVQYHPEQARHTASNKCYAAIYIDDRNLGCPLKMDESVSSRPFIDWERAEKWLEERWVFDEMYTKTFKHPYYVADT
jgi:hypothetical protein